MGAFALLAWLMSAAFFTGTVACSATSEDKTAEEDEKVEAEEEARLISENYHDLISELETLLEEFELLFEELGQASLAGLSDQIQEFRTSLREEFSRESYEEIMMETEDVLEELEEIQSDLDDTESRANRKYLRRLTAFERDLEDIYGEMEEYLSDDKFQEVLESEEMQKAMEKAIEAYNKKLEKMERQQLPAAPLPPAMLVPSVSQDDYSQWWQQHSAQATGDLDASLTQNGSATVASDKIQIELKNRIGSVEVTTWNQSSVSAVLTIDYSEDSRTSRDLAKEIRLAIASDDKAVTVEVYYPRDREKTAGIVASSLAVSMPRQNPLRVENSFGPVAVSDLQNRLTIASSFASIDVQRLEGETIITNANGPVYLETVRGKVQVSNSFGPVEGVALIGPAQIANSYAPVAVRRSVGRLEISNSGNVSVQTHKGDVLIDASNGEVEAYQIDGGLTLNNSFGSVVIENVTGPILAQNANASLEIRNAADRVEAKNSFGDINVDGTRLDLRINSSNGAVTVENVHAGVVVDNSFGEVTLRTVAGPVGVNNSNAAVSVIETQGDVNVSNQFGPVYLREIGGSVIVHNKNGSVELLEVGGASTVRTSFGDVSGEGLKGPLVISNQNGSIELMRLYLKQQDRCELSATFGDVNLTLLRPLNYNITAQTTGGDIDSDFPMVHSTTGQVSTAEYTGAVIGPVIVITGQNGSIEISAQD